MRLTLSLWIAIIALVVSTLFYACTRKDSFQGSGKETEQGLSIEKARKAYADLVKREGNIVPDQERLSIAADGTISRSVAPTGKPNKKVVLWSKAKLSVSPNGNPFVELPLLYNKKTSSLIVKKGEVRDANNEIKIFNGSVNRLLIYLDKRTGNYNEYIVDYIPRIEYLRRHNGDISSNRMSELNKDFSGYVQYKKWDGTRLALYELEDGKTVKFIRFTNSNKSIKVSKMHSGVASSSGNEVGGQSVEKLMSGNTASIQSKISTSSSSMESCEWVDIYDYQTVCWETNPEDPMEVTCTSVPVLVGSDYVCTGGEDDPDPGDPDPCDLPQNYDWCYGTGNPGGPNPNNPPPPPSNSSVLNAIANKPFALFGDIDCAVIRKWLDLASFTPSQSLIDDKLIPLNNALAIYGIDTWFPPITADGVANIQNINNAHSPVVNMDYFSVTITELPSTYDQQWTAAQLLNYIRLNINDFTDDNDFYPYNAYGINDSALWASNTPTGAVIAIDIPGPDNGSVITSYATTNKWTFSTIYEPMYQTHPVSGNRDFGYISNPDGSYTFYTRGVDRLTEWSHTFAQNAANIPFNGADALWSSLQSHIKAFVETWGGTAVINSPNIHRPNWEIVKDVLEGSRPLSDLSKDCPPTSL